MGRAVWNEPSQSWFVTSFNDAREVMNNVTDYRQAEELFTEIFGGPVLMGEDNPRHKQLRDIWDKSFRPTGIINYAELVGEIARKRIAPVLERLRDGEVVDVIPHLRMIPTELTARMLGVPPEDCEQFISWGHRIVEQFHVFNSPDDKRAEELRQSAVAATQALHDYSGDVLEQRRRAGDTDDLLGMLAATDVPMTEQEKRSYITILIEGAQDTSTKFMTNSLLALAQHADQRQALTQDRDLVRQMLEEALRMFPPAMLNIRIARRPGVRIGDVEIPEGDHVSPAICAANRDPSRWDNPHSFDIFRPTRTHLTFGFGLHHCMGAHLSRLLGKIVINMVLDATPNYQLATEKLDYGRAFIIRGPAELALRL
jgi:cytochrome P450